jgi:hypothetical protein
VGVRYALNYQCDSRGLDNAFVGTHLMNIVTVFVTFEDQLSLCKYCVRQNIHLLYIYKEYFIRFLLAV